MVNSPLVIDASFSVGSSFEVLWGASLAEWAFEMEYLLQNHLSIFFLPLINF